MPILYFLVYFWELYVTHLFKVSNKQGGYALIAYLLIVGTA